MNIHVSGVAKPECRILHFAQRIAGGPASYLEELAEHQLQRYGTGSIRFLVPAEERHHLGNVPDECLIQFQSFERDALALWSLQAKAMREIEAFAPDIVHLHSTFAGALIRGRYLLARKRPKIVYCAHGWAFGRQTGSATKMLCAGVERTLMRATDVCINISEFEANSARTFGIPMAKCVTINNGIRDIAPTGPPPRALPADKINLIFVGRHDPQKGIDILLDAMRGLARSDIQLHVVGAPVVSTRLVGELRQRENVTFHGWMAREEAAAMIASCDALVAPSRWEGFGLAVTEAMRASRPAIVSNRGALPSLVVSGETGFVVDIATSRPLAETLASLERPQLQKMGAAARRRYLERFTAASMNDAIDRCYDRLLAKRAASPAPSGAAAPLGA